VDSISTPPKVSTLQPTYLCGLKWRKLYHASFLRQIHDLQMVHVVNGKGTLQILLTITDDIVEAVKVDPSAVTN